MGSDNCGFVRVIVVLVVICFAPRKQAPSTQTRHTTDHNTKTEQKMTGSPGAFQAGRDLKIQNYNVKNYLNDTEDDFSKLKPIPKIQIKNKLPDRITIKRLLTDYCTKKESIIYKSDKEVRSIAQDFSKRGAFDGGTYREAQKDHALKIYREINNIFRSMKRGIEDRLADFDKFKSQTSLSEEYRSYCKEYKQLKEIYAHLEKPVKKEGHGIAKGKYGNFYLEIPNDLTMP